ncbi:MAG: HaeIII family restriction endonuclease [Neisseriaceae bacterium]|nr:HaeIII family restriction endonuclease [Neisseriaceae bacterium]
MSNQSNKLGRAYEYACLISLFNAIDKIRQVKIIENSSFTTALKSWELLTIEEQEQYLISANAIINTIFEFEPLIQEKNNNDILELQLQQDNKGETADVRDILIIRSSIGWEIGLSVKHNHFAAKHSRLSKNIDFGEKWLNIPVSQNYKNEIHPIFTYLEQEKQKGTNWRDLTDKEDKIYYPLMLAFKNELNRIYQQHGAIVARKMVEYFLGKYDFYKIISVDNKQKTQLQVFNLYQ